MRSLGTAALLLATAGPPRELRRFADLLLGGLLDPPDDRSRELLHTLRVWLANGCSTARTAEVLMGHINTAAYRLRRVAEVLACDLGATDTRLDLRLALLVHDVAVVGPTFTSRRSPRRRAGRRP